MQTGHFDGTFFSTCSLRVRVTLISIFFFFSKEFSIRSVFYNNIQIIEHISNWARRETQTIFKEKRINRYLRWLLLSTTHKHGDKYEQNKHSKRKRQNVMCPNIALQVHNIILLLYCIYTHAQYIL